jgi:hypothetical protein
MSSVAPETAVKLRNFLGHRLPDGATLADIAAYAKWCLVRDEGERAQPGFCRFDPATWRRAAIATRGVSTRGLKSPYVVGLPPRAGAFSGGERLRL